MAERTKNGIDALLDIMKRLRDPDRGCEWDKAQTPESILPHTLEEAYEVCDAVEKKDAAQLKEELGDLLLHIVFYAQMAKERGLFDFQDVVDGVCAKMIRRHPHIFGNAAERPDWERLKADERREHHQDGVLSGIADALPQTIRAFKLQSRAARVGFDWAAPLLIVDKIYEEVNELKAEIVQPSHDRERLDEMGDVLFVCVNLARKLQINPEQALKHANAKFERRFGHIEKRLKEAGKPFEQTTLAEMEDLWVEAKKIEKAEIKRSAPDAPQKAS